MIKNATFNLALQSFNALSRAGMKKNAACSPQLTGRE